MSIFFVHDPCKNLNHGFLHAWRITHPPLHFPAPPWVVLPNGGGLGQPRRCACGRNNPQAVIKGFEVGP